MKKKASKEFLTSTLDSQRDRTFFLHFESQLHVLDAEWLFDGDWPARLVRDSKYFRKNP